MGQQAKIGAGLKVHIGVFTRDTNLASGNQVVGGVGFQPKLVIFFAGVNNATGETSWGFDDNGTKACFYDKHDEIANAFGFSEGFSIYDYDDGIDGYRGVLNAMGADGFTVAWSKVANPVGTLTCEYFALG